MKKIVFSGFVASMLMASGAAFATGNVTLASQGYVDKGLRTLYGVIDAAKVDKDAVYTKEDSDAKFLTTHQDVSGKADADDVYTKDEADALFLTEDDIEGLVTTTNVYTKDEADAKFLASHQDISGKADADSVYTKTESDEKFLVPPELEGEEEKMFLYTSDGWSEVTVKDTFPNSYSFGG